MLVLTVQETNKLRAQIGLQLIPLEKNETTVKKDTAHMVKNERNTIRLNMRKGENGCFAISLEETNRLRDIVGLKPISSESGYENEVVTDNQRTKNISKIKKRLRDITSGLQVADKLSKGGIIERVDGDASHEDEASWLEHMGERKVMHSGSLKLRLKQGPDAKNDRTKNMSDKQRDMSSDHERMIQETQSSQNAQNSGNAKDIDILAKALPRSAVSNLHANTIQKKRKLMVVLDDSEIDNNRRAPSDYVKPKKIKHLRKKTKDRFRNREKFDIVRGKLQNVKLVNEDIGNDDDEDIRHFMDASRKKSLARKTSARDVEIENSQHSKITPNSKVGFKINEELEFLNRFNETKSAQKQGKQKDIKTDVHSDDLSEEHTTDSGLGGRNISKILEGKSKETSTLGISTILQALKEKDSENESPSDNINLVYTDDNGRVLSTKEAYKYLSHKFHGFKKR